MFLSVGSLSGSGAEAHTGFGTDLTWAGPGQRPRVPIPSYSLSDALHWTRTNLALVQWAVRRRRDARTPSVANGALEGR